MKPISRFLLPALILAQGESARIGMVIDIEDFPSSVPSELTPCGGYLYFKGSEHLYRYDGSVEEGELSSDPSSVKEVGEGYYSYLTCFHDDLYYAKGKYIWSPIHLVKFNGQETVLYEFKQ